MRRGGDRLIVLILKTRKENGKNGGESNEGEQLIHRFQNRPVAGQTARHAHKNIFVETRLSSGNTRRSVNRDQSLFIGICEDIFDTARSKETFLVVKFRDISMKFLKFFYTCPYRSNKII